MKTLITSLVSRRGRRKWDVGARPARQGARSPRRGATNRVTAIDIDRGRLILQAWFSAEGEPRHTPEYLLNFRSIAPRTYWAAPLTSNGGVRPVWGRVDPQCTLTALAVRNAMEDWPGSSVNAVVLW